MSCVEEIGRALSGQEDATPTLSVHNLPPLVLKEDWISLAKILKKFNGGPAVTDLAFVGMKIPSSRYNFFSPEAIKRLDKDALAVMTMRIVFNARYSTGELRRFKPGFLNVVVQELLKNGSLASVYDYGKTIPLVHNGAFFGVALITAPEFNRHPHPQFALIFDFATTETEDVILDILGKNLQAP